jgi:hypothetical protein
MKPSYLHFFGFSHEPFGADLRVDQILHTPKVLVVSDRFDYTVRLGAIGLVTGEVGSGQSTALRFALSRLHPSEYRPLWITASSGSILECYRQLASELEVDTNSFSRAALLRIIRRQILELACNRKQKPIRPAVQWRKICFGNQSDAGERFTERIVTVTRTCNLQGKNAFHFLSSLMEAAFMGSPRPSPVR